MAHEYICEMRTRQPSGPYFIAGMCFGGCLSFVTSSALRADRLPHRGDLCAQQADQVIAQLLELRGR
jgi:surfactin synthase thioesterase subunit